MKRIRNRSIRYIGLTLALCVLLSASPLMSAGADALASDDYTQWKQSDEEWNSSAAWSGSYAGFIADSGCWITTISMLLRQYGLVSKDVDEFNPWICAGEMYSAGALTGGGLTVLSKVGTAFPGFDHAGTYTYSFSLLRELFDEGYACALLVRGGGHMVAVQDVLDDGTVKILDPGWDYTELSQWGGATQIIAFGPIEAVEEERVIVPEEIQVFTV